MRHLIETTALTSIITAAFVAAGSMVHASGFTEPRVDPEPLAPSCTIWFGLPCHEGYAPNPSGGGFEVPPQPEEPKEQKQEPDEEECAAAWSIGRVVAPGYDVGCA